MTSTTLRGSSLPSSPHRTADKLYVNDRSVGILTQLRVPADVLTVAKRGDEILDRTTSTGEAPSPEGRLTLGELDRLDKAENKAVLFPNEAASIGAVHKLFEVPASTPVALPPVKTLAYKLERQLVAPAVTMARIADLPAHLQVAAKRLQLVKDGDTDAATIQATDIEWARQGANTGRFTQQTMNELGEIYSRFHGDQYAEKVVGILPAAEQKQLLADVGPVKVSISTRLGFRTQSTNRYHPPYAWTPQLASRALNVEVPTGYTAFVKATGQVGTSVQFEEHVVKPGDAALQLAALAANGRTLWIQVFDANGAIVQNARYDLPVTQLETFQLAPELARRQVNEWRDPSGNVFMNNQVGGYSLDGHDHLFAARQINTSI
jgi:hypothetical protein